MLESAPYDKNGAFDYMEFTRRLKCVLLLLIFFGDSFVLSCCRGCDPRHAAGTKRGCLGAHSSRLERDSHSFIAVVVMAADVGHGGGGDPNAIQYVVPFPINSCARIR